MTPEPPLRFAVVGLEHPHVYAMALALLGEGFELAGFLSENDDAAAGFGEVFGAPHRYGALDEVLADDDVDLVVAVGVPADRAGVAVAAMGAGKDVLADKPAVTTAAQLEEVRSTQAASGRNFSIWFSERVESRATERASRLVGDGAIGAVVQVVGFGPHRLGIAGRPPWFFEPDRNGGILNDLASHQIDQFLHFAGVEAGPLRVAEQVELVSSMVANRAHPDHPGLEDYGEVHLRTATVSGWSRVDWLTPDGLPTWGDVRLFLVGTEGTIEVRKNVDIAGLVGGDHLILVDGREIRRFDCRHDPLPFVGRLAHDLRTRSTTHMTPDHCFAVCELALRAQSEATRAGHLR